MDPSVWSRSPSTTNAVECLNAECKSKLPVTLQHALSNVYRLDKSVCAKHLAGLKVYLIMRRLRMLRGQVLQRGNTSILYPVYLLIRQQHMGYLIEPVTLE